MDPLTHMALGASLAMVLSPRPRRRAAALGGAIAGLLPDADIFIRSAHDPLLAIEYHRHFTHSFLFQPVVAAVAWMLVVGLQRVFLGPGRPRASYLPLVVAAISHPLCDGWTSYGTRLWWPFSPERVAWDWTSVIDPILTLPLILLCVWGIRRRSWWMPAAGLAWVSVYLVLAVGQGQRATEALQAHLKQQGVQVERLSVRPSFGNILVWRGVWQDSAKGRAQLHCAAIRAGRTMEITPGESAPAVDLQGDPQLAAWAPPGSTLRRDLERFAHFSADWLVWEPGHPGVIGDARYSMAPTELDPLWGIGVSDRTPDAHAEFLTFREGSSQRLRTLWRLIVGGAAPGGGASDSVQIPSKHPWNLPSNRPSK
ncbi:MAG: metal-dependent hydrolase [Planctomycetes bacterium]|nr:metal-dependent hydrolase [Planctomycetota bacterium]